MEAKTTKPGMQLLILFALIIVMITVGDIVFRLVLPFLIEPEISPEDIDFSTPTLMLTHSLIFTFFTFIGAVFVFLKITKQKFKNVFLWKKIQLKPLLIIVGILIGSLILMEFLSMLNEPLKNILPNNQFIIRELENREFEKVLLVHDSPIRWMASVFVMAILPAIGEELVFRGILLSALKKASNNIHFAVIVSALIFAGLHEAPLKLLPMIFMGICFGYVYVYFKNIKYTIIMHFLNNAIMISAVYFYPELL